MESDEAARWASGLTSKFAMLIPTTVKVSSPPKVSSPSCSGVAWVGPDLVLMPGKGEEADPIAAGRFKVPPSTWQRIAGRFIRHRTTQAEPGRMWITSVLLYS